MCSTKKCRCNCGYTCGGPGTCKVFTEDFQRCLTEHFKKDCDHVWDGPTVESWMGHSVTCSHCGTLAMQHDMAVGP